MQGESDEHVRKFVFINAQAVIAIDATGYSLSPDGLASLAKGNKWGETPIFSK